MPKLEIDKYAEEKKVAKLALENSRLFSGVKNLKIGELGHGGTGAVFQIFIDDKATDKVIKVPLFDENAEDNISLISDEAKTLESLKGKRNIVQQAEIIDVKVNFPNGESYTVRTYISEKLEPINTERYFSSGDPERSEKLACEFLCDITQALCDIENEYPGVHRDIKLKNIMCKQDAHNKDVSKLIDFSIFKGTPGNNTYTDDTGSGTKYYMSPERVFSSKFSPACDIYNLGLVMYNILSVDHSSIAMDITDSFPKSMSAHECNIEYLNNVYGKKITKEMVLDDSTRIYPRSELFSSAYLNGSKEIRELIRKMLALNYHHRPSAEQIQKHTLHILDSLRTKLKFRMSDYSFYSAYAQFDNEAKNKKASNLGNTEHRRKSRSNPSNRKTEKPTRTVPHGAVIFTVLALEAVFNGALLLLQLFNSPLYEVLTGVSPLFPNDRDIHILLSCLAILFHLVSRTLLLRKTYRYLIRQNAHTKTSSSFFYNAFIWLIVCYTLLFAAKFLIMYFSGSYNFNILFRWVYEGVLSIALCVSGSELIRKNQDIDFLDIRKRKPLRMRYSGVIRCVIVAFMMIFFMTRPAYEITNHIVTSVVEQIGDSDALNEYQPKNIYTEGRDLTVEEKIDNAKIYTYLAGVFSIIGIVMLFVVIIPCNLIFREINKEIKSPVTDLRIRTPKELPPKSKKQERVYDINKPAVRINHPAIHAMKTILNLDELEKLSAENCEFDIVSANELAKIEMDMLSEVHLDDNDIGEMSADWLSRRVRKFTCCRCNLKTTDGLGNSISLLESFDCRENDLESIDFLSHSNESLRCAKLSYNYFTPEAIERALEGCCKLEELDIGFNKSALNTEQNEMSENYIESIEFLRPFDHLRSLSIVDADLEDLDPLKNKNLEKLRLAYCDIEDISALSDSVLSSQAYLDLEGNDISDISFLPKIYYRVLNISNNDVRDFSHLNVLSGEHIIISDAGSDDFFEQLKNLHQFEHVTILGIPLWRQNKAERILQRLSSLDKIEVTMTEENHLPDNLEEGSPEYCSAYHETYLRMRDSWEEKSDE